MANFSESTSLTVNTVSFNYPSPLPKVLPPGLLVKVGREFLGIDPSCHSDIMEAREGGRSMDDSKLEPSSFSLMHSILV